MPDRHDSLGLRIPALRTRASLAWLGATALGPAAVAVHGIVTRPDDRAWAVIVLVVLLLLPVLLWRTAWLDAQAGVVTIVGRGRRRRRVPLGAGTRVELVDNRAGVMSLGLRPAGARRRTYLPLLAHTPYLELSQQPDVLRALADALERHGAQGALRHGADGALGSRADGAPGDDAQNALLVVAQLRAQADAVARGTHPRLTPLATAASRRGRGATLSGDPDRR